MLFDLEDQLNANMKEVQDKLEKQMKEHTDLKDEKICLTVQVETLKDEKERIKQQLNDLEKLISLQKAMDDMSASELQKKSKN